MELNRKGEVILSSLKISPNNPRKFKLGGFERLLTSLREFPKMLTVRGIIVDNEDNIVAGNQKAKGLKKLGYKAIPAEWVKKAQDFTPEELRRLMLMDNDHAGENDIDNLKENWDMGELEAWGVDMEPFLKDEDKVVSFTVKEKPPKHILSIEFDTEKALRSALSKLKNDGYNVKRATK